MELVPLDDYRRLPEAEMVARAEGFAAQLGRRRTVRDFADDPVPEAVVLAAIRAATTAPSGANQQPWHFCLIGKGELRAELRAAAEAEERAFYAERAGPEWLEALAPLGTDWRKPFLETAPWLIAVFAERHGIAADGARRKHYYVGESVGIATGLLLATLHRAGLVTLTHTPSPMGFLNRVCGRPEREKPFILIVTGYPAADARTPAAARVRKPLDQVLSRR
ncbi:MAG: nitroreductase family protein [Geminicoccaceae bacterium]|nr:nitroreductase family protein [Geminicoccaceae bacterium]MCB9966899.1 nitroreductase family protein [Geminicoccaceae bacterium]